MSEKTHTQEFEACVTQVMDQGHEKSSAFAICTDSFQKAGKPIFVGVSESKKLHLFCESFKLEGNRVSGVAIHPKRIFHPEEDMTHVYLREELEKAAPTLAGKPFGIDHMYILPPPNLATEAWYDKKQNAVAFRGLVDDHIAEKIRKKEFKGISIELDWLRPGGSVEYVNGVAARNFELTSLHFLTRFPPGDPDAFCKLVEAAEKKLVQMKEQLVVGPAKPVDEQLTELRQQFDAFQNAVNERLARIEGALGQVTFPPSPLGLQNPSETIEGKNVSKKLKEQNQNQEPEKDEHGCIVGKEKWDAETEKCVLIKTPAQESLKARKALMKKLREQGDVDECIRRGLEADMLPYEIAIMCGVTEDQVMSFQEQQGNSPGKSAAERAKQHHNISDEAWDKLSDEEKQAYIDTLPPPGTKLKEQGNQQEPEKDEHGCVIGKERYDEETKKCVAITAEAQVAFLEAKMRLKEQEGELSIEELKAKIADLAKQREELDKKLWPEPPESGLSEEEKAAIRTQIDVLWAEIDAYEQALKIKIAGLAAPPQTPPTETDLQKIKETIVALRKKLVEAEATIANIEKKKKLEAATWKEKYETLREAVKGAIPVPRVWKSWTPGPQRYVQENLKILREIEGGS